MENQATETRVLMHTNKGDIKLKLYNDTPLHRDNFIKLVKEGQYNFSFISPLLVCISTLVSVA